jgi:hypothetical protein
MPIVAATLTAGQWDAWERDYYVKTKSKKGARTGGTLADRRRRPRRLRRGRRQGQPGPAIRSAAGVPPEVSPGARHPIGCRYPGWPQTARDRQHRPTLNLGGCRARAASRSSALQSVGIARVAVTGGPAHTGPTMELATGFVG